MRVVALVQARMSSTRLPGKVMLRTCGKSLLAHQLERIARSRRIDRLAVATSVDPTDDAIESLCRELGVPVHRGSLDDVLDRFVRGARAEQAGWVVRLTGDCPLSDPRIIDQVIEKATSSGLDYVSNCLKPSFPDGLDAECMKMEVLEAAGREASLGSQREHVTPFIHQQPERFALGEVRSDVDHSELRWTVDEAADFVFVSQVYEHLYPIRPQFDSADVLALLRENPHLQQINGSIVRNEGYMRSLRRDHGVNP